jgi:hypothetical protein
MAAKNCPAKRPALIYKLDQLVGADPTRSVLLSIIRKDSESRVQPGFICPASTARPRAGNRMSMIGFEQALRKR